MNEKHPGGAGAESGDPQDSAAAPHGGAPFRRLRSGRRRAEGTAPLDDHFTAGSSDPDAGRVSRRAAAAGEPEPAAAGSEHGDPDPAGTKQKAIADPASELADRDHHHAEVLEAHPPVTGVPRHDQEEILDGGTVPPTDDAEAAAAPEPSDDEDDPTAALLLSGERTAPGVRKRRRRRRNIIMTVMVAIFAVILAGTVLVLQNVLGMWNPEDYAGPGEGEVTFTVEPGWGPSQIGRHLTESGIVASEELFIEAIPQVDAESKVIHPGEYEMKYKMPAVDAATILIGEAGEKVNYVPIKQNIRTDAVFEQINRATGISIDELEALNEKPGEFGLKDPVKNLEGFLHPGQYRFPLDASAKDILQQMVDATVKELTSQGVTDPAEQYKMLKIASILQAEARPEDYKTVSGALDNRLKPGNTETGGYLQVDSSVIYGLGQYSLQFTAEEKHDASNPYNTYEHKGLPPTPIGSPGDSAIEAAIHPEDNDYYYWVTVNTQTGETKFAETYEQHQVYQQEFRDWCGAHEDICK
ncbi:endolytic transglycosylase MltG [Arthrobacter sp. JSM 101049]|uniref:endolytic transglycosylase MltG n=1 Tax=Arthrobacter sp. JSM 101049 TaxID=929097 RepID=UPI00356844B8